MDVPSARGEVTEILIARLTAGERAPLDDLAATTTAALAASDDVLTDDDLQLALFLMYELHYGGLDGVADTWEWDPRLLAVRERIEREFEAALRRAVSQPRATRDVSEALFALVTDDDGPSLSAFVERDATAEQVREILACRTIYTLKEADPHSWAIPRLHGRAKSALVEIQADEYGGGRPERLHATIFAAALRGAGLDDRYGAYADHVPATVYTSMNLMSLFGLHRRLRGAIVGHLAAYEMTSSLPCRAYATGLRRLGFGDDVTDYFDEHVEADAVHEQLAARDLAGSLADDEPEIANDILFGAAACLAIDGRLWGGLRERFEVGESALRKPLP
ncbi:iron-containing redox enzyme family protein [Agromyces subbeticus]|uniref:iron-containing redox enzyme family protein n=1 Tax=Agromyces subbeticus TaxID=293890 RepID=UPI0003B32B98|nr:iron-containing redox enzyme family protein [Agromyces subbeticus]